MRIHGCSRWTLHVLLAALAPLGIGARAGAGNPPPSPAMDLPGSVRFTFDAAGQPEGWEGNGSFVVRQVAHGAMQGRIEGAEPQLSRGRLHLQAGLLDGLAVRLTATHPGRLTLYWAHDKSDRFGGARRTTVPVEPGTNAMHCVYFDLRQAEEWKGHLITRLRFDLAFPRGTQVAIDSIELSGSKNERVTYPVDALTGPDVGHATIFMDNGFLRLGAACANGASINFLSADGGGNLVNTADQGRLIQQSYYAGAPLDRTAVGQHGGWSPWAWNPIQGGDASGQPGKVLAIRGTATGDGFFTRTVPLLWDMTTAEEGQAWMDQWNRFEPGMSNVIRVTCRLICRRDADDVWGGAVPRHQELPAVYLVRNLSKTVTYQGKAPWTGASTDQVPTPGPPWGRYHPTETWVAMADPATDVGVGLYSPIGTEVWNVGATDQPAGADARWATMHMAPIRSMALDRDSIMVYRYWLVYGDLETIRSRVYQLHAKYPVG